MEIETKIKENKETIYVALIGAACVAYIAFLIYLAIQDAKRNKALNSALQNPKLLIKKPCPCEDKEKDAAIIAQASVEVVETEISNAIKHDKETVAFMPDPLPPDNGKVIPVNNEIALPPVRGE
jgi:hypothetical protein